MLFQPVRDRIRTFQRSGALIAVIACLTALQFGCATSQFADLETRTVMEPDHNKSMSPAWDLDALEMHPDYLKPHRLDDPLEDIEWLF